MFGFWFGALFVLLWCLLDVVLRLVCGLFGLRVVFTFVFDLLICVCCCRLFILLICVWWLICFVLCWMPVVAYISGWFLIVNLALVFWLLCLGLVEFVWVSFTFALIWVVV